MVFRDTLVDSETGGRPSDGRVLLWLQEVRLPFAVVTVLPALFGAAVAGYSHARVDTVALLVSLAAAVLVHLGANVINDYFDYRNGTDAANTEYVRGFTGGSRMIQEGRMSPREVLAGAVALLAAGAALVLYLAVRSGYDILLMGAAAVTAAVVYSVFLHSFYIGELIVALCFGTLVPAGSYFVQTGFVSPGVLAASAPMALLVFLILFINEVPDYTADRASGKKTLVVRMGRRKAARLYAWTMAAVYIYIAGMAAAFRLPLLLASLLTLPLAVSTSARLLRYAENPALLRPGVVATIALFTLNSLVVIAAFALKRGGM